MQLSLLQKHIIHLLFLYSKENEETPEEQVEKLSWYFKGMDRATAVEKLKHAKVGTYLLRDSRQYDDGYVLTMK